MQVNKGKKASVLYLVATLFNKGIAFLTVPVFTRLLSTSDYGIVTTYNSWVDILTVFLSLALYMAIRTAFIDFKEEKLCFLNTVITFTLLFSVFVAVGAVFLSKFLTGIAGVIVFFAVVQGAASALLMDYQQYLMMELKYVQRSLFMSLPNLFSVILSIGAIILIPFPKMYLGRIIPTMAIYVVFAGIILVRIYGVQKPGIKREHLKYGLLISLPLVFHGIALNVLSQSDRTMITVLADASQTGIYSLVYNFGMLAAVLTTALDGVWLPWFMNQMKQCQFDAINKVAKDYIQFMTCTMVGLILVGPEILKILAAPEYWGGISIIPPIVLANYFIFAYTFYVNVEHFYKKTMGITINTLVAAVVNIVLNFILIPKYGFVAAAYTTIASYFLALILHAGCSRRLESKVFPPDVFVKPLLLVVVTVVLYYFLIDYWFMRWSLAVLIVGGIGVMERKTIKAYFGLSKR